MPISLEQAKQALQTAQLCYSKEAVESAIDKMAQAMHDDLAEKNPLFLCVMNGGLIITGQLLLRLDFPLHYDYVHATRYHNQTSGGDLKWLSKPSRSLQDRHVVIVDDILDEGITLAALVAYCKAEGAQEVYTAVLVEKEHQRKHFVNPDYVGLSVEDSYVFGYGMDYHGYHRNLSGIYKVDE